MDRCDAYRHFAAQCVELSCNVESPQDRGTLLQMALIWSRLAEYAAHASVSQSLKVITTPGHDDSGT
jgi:hypothetical protein